LAQESSVRIGARHIQLNLTQSYRERASLTRDVPVGDGKEVVVASDSRLIAEQFAACSELDERVQSIFPVSVAIADKNPMVLRALEALLTGDIRFNLLLKESDGTRFLNSLAHHPVRLGVIGWELLAKNRGLQRHEESSRSCRNMEARRGRFPKQAFAS
jgi:hypothetical protein